LLQYGPSISATRADSPSPTKRLRPADMDSYHTNGNNSSSSIHPHAKPHAGTTTGSGSLPPLSLSILGVEPLDEFIKEIADFIHHMIMVVSPNYPSGRIEVEAKVGVLRDRISGRRFELPVLVETSMSCGFFYAPCPLIFLTVAIIKSFSQTRLIFSSSPICLQYVFLLSGTVSLGTCLTATTQTLQ